MILTMLGTGNALVTNCYNTCFVLQENEEYFMVDAGGGNGILHQLKKARIDWKKVKDIFITHKHIDHLMGAVWMTRIICQYMHQNQYEGEANIYGHSEVIHILHSIADMVLQQKETRLINKRMHFITVEDGESRKILGHKTTFFDIHSTKAKQFGFTMEISNRKRLTCCGDEPYNDVTRKYVEGSDWLLHEAFCLFSEADIFKPYEKHHSTVREACQLAESLGINNLLLYHTEDKNISNRKELYMAEGAAYFSGNLYIPNDLESIRI